MTEPADSQSDDLTGAWTTADNPATSTDTADNPLRDVLARAIELADEHSCQMQDGPDYRALAAASLHTMRQHLDIGEEEAWCKICRRVWEGPRHRCESDAEQRLSAARDLRDDLRGITGARWIADALDTILDRPTPATTEVGDNGPSVAEAAKDDRRWPLQKAGE